MDRPSSGKTGLIVALECLTRTSHSISHWTNYALTSYVLHIICFLSDGPKYLIFMADHTWQKSGYFQCQHNWKPTRPRQHQVYMPKVGPASLP